MANVVSRRKILLVGAALAIPGCGGAKLSDGATDGGVPPPVTVPPPIDGGVTLDGGGPADVPVEPAVGGPGVVVEVSHSGAVVNEVVQAAPVRQIMERGMLALTGRATEEAAWRALFSPQDVVGIKVNPVGYPKAFSQVATVAEIIRGLNLAGVANQNIVVFERYRDILDAAGYPALLPQGIRFAGIVDTYTEDQTGLQGYDPSVYVELPRVHPGDDPNDVTKRRSHLSSLVSRTLTKVVNVPSLKDHISAGLTMALKNMTYGMVNNVSRTHVAPDNWTKDFLPVVAAMPQIRSKVVLHVADALVGCYAGGPGPVDSNFQTFVRGSLLFATDPVALDRIGLKILDEQRQAMGLPPVASCGLQLTNPGGEAFDERQPQYIEAAAALGLGIADLQKIQLRSFVL